MNSYLRIRKRLLGALVTLALVLVSSGIARAEGPVAHVILFFSPTCPYCHVVMDDVLPPLQAYYGAQLVIQTIDVSTAGGQMVYQNAVVTLGISDDRLGVPALVINDLVLVGSSEIPQRLPSLIEQTLAAGGNSWPAIPGFSPATSTEAAAAPRNLFERDPLNSVAITVLLLMIVSVGLVGMHIRRSFPPPITGWRAQAIPVLAVAGMAVAAYLAYVEVSGTPAVCGPVGDCNTVQQSPYAQIFGIPLGVLGVLGYSAILAAWAGQHFGSGNLAHWAARALPWGSFAGTLFSIYLTFLEPFVIGASCIWCLTSAVLMTALLWITVPQRSAPVKRGRPRRSPAH